MPLPEGRKPLSDQDMIALLHDMARNLSPRDIILSRELRETADRLNELSENEKVSKYGR